MRWEQLFDDLEAQFEAFADAELQAELADRERVAVGAVRLIARLAGAVGDHVRIRAVSGAVQVGRLQRVGPDWLLLEPSPGQQLLLPAAVVTVIEGLGRQTGSAPAGLALRLDFRHMIRGLARDRSPVAVTLVGEGGVELTGTFDRVGADFAELAQHAPWEPRRASAVRSVATVPLTAMASVRAMPLG